MGTSGAAAHLVSCGRDDEGSALSGRLPHVGMFVCVCPENPVLGEGFVLTHETL